MSPIKVTHVGNDWVDLYAETGFTTDRELRVQILSGQAIINTSATKPAVDAPGNSFVVTMPWAVVNSATAWIRTSKNASVTVLCDGD